MPMPMNAGKGIASWSLVMILVMYRLLNVQAFRFGNDAEALLKAIDIGFEKSVKPRNEVYKGCLKTLEMVCAALSSLATSLHSLQGRASMGARPAALSPIAW